MLKNYCMSINKTWWMFLYIILILFNVQQGANITKVTVVVFAIISLLVIKARIKILPQMWMWVVFIIWNLSIVFLGNVYDKSHSLAYIETITINLIIYILIYNVLIKENAVERMLKCYIITTIVSSATIVLGNRESLFAGRLSFTWREENVFQLFGISFHPIGSNGLSTICCIAIAFSTYFIVKNKSKKLYTCAILILTITIFLTGSRKGLLLFLLIIISTVYFYSFGIKKIINAFSLVILIICILYGMKYISVFYNIVGERFFKLINIFLGDELVDGSYVTRSQLIKSAINYFKDSPIIGHGLDAFRVMSGRGICIDNNFLEILVSSGLVGFLIYYSYIPITIYQINKIKTKSSILRIMLWVMIFLLFMQIGNVTYYLRLEWIYLVLLFYQIKIDKQMVGNKKRSLM